MKFTRIVAASIALCALGATVFAEGQKDAGKAAAPQAEVKPIVLRLGEIRLRDAPQFPGAHPRREAARELLAVDEPLGLGIAAHEGGGKQEVRARGHGFSPWNSFSRPSLIPNSPSYMNTSAVANVSP